MIGLVGRTPDKGLSDQVQKKVYLSKTKSAGVARNNVQRFLDLTRDEGINSKQRSDAG